MSDDSISRHLQAALAEIVSKRKAELHATYDKSDADHTERREKLAPLLLAIAEIKNQVSDHKTIQISVAPHGHMVTVRAGVGSYHNLSISANYASGSTPANSLFTVEERIYYSFDGSSHEKQLRFDTADDVLGLVLEIIGKEIGMQETLQERKAKS